MFEKRIAWIAVLPLLAACGGPQYPWTQAAVAERPSGPSELPAYPRDGQTAGVNPPGFTWTPNEKAKTYRLELRRAAGSRSILSTAPQSSTVYAPADPLPPGDYAWQVVYLDAAGAPAGASRTRQFKLPAGLPSLPMPDVARLKTATGRRAAAALPGRQPPVRNQSRGRRRQRRVVEAHAGSRRCRAG